MSTEHDPRWDVLQRAETEIVRRFTRHGVVDVEYVAGFPELEGVGVWLVVKSDRERDALGVPFDHARDPDVRSAQRRLRDQLTKEVATVLQAEAEGLVLGEVIGVVQSQEAVDRDFDGSWFRAMR